MTQNIYHTTWSTYNTKKSSKNIHYSGPSVNPVYLSQEQEVIISESVADSVIKDDLKIYAYNICTNHVHLLIECEENNISGIIQKLKGRSSRKLNLESSPVWAQKFNTTYIPRDNKKLESVKEYIDYNRTKHELEENTELKPIINRILNPENKVKNNLGQGTSVPCSDRVV